MKLSCSSWSYHRAFESGRFSVLSWIDFCSENLGLDGVEVEDKHFDNTDPVYFQAVKRRLADHGLVLANVTTFNDFGHESTAQNQRELERVQRWIDHALALGAPSLRVFAGWPQGALEPAWQRMLDFLQQATEHAERQGVTLVLENHNHGGFIQTSSDTLRVIDEIASPRLRPLLDTGNYLDGVCSIEKVVPLAAHVHAKVLHLDGAGAEINIDHEQIVGLLRRAGYTRFVSVEYEGDEEEGTAVPRAIAYLKRLTTRSASSSA